MRLSRAAEPVKVETHVFFRHRYSQPQLRVKTKILRDRSIHTARASPRSRCDEDGLLDGKINLVRRNDTSAAGSLANAAAAPLSETSIRPTESSIWPKYDSGPTLADLSARAA